MGKRKLQRGRLQRYAEFLANTLQRIDTRENIGRRVGIIEFAVPRENAGIESTGDNDADTAFGAAVHESKALLLQQRIAAGEHGDVDIEDIHGVADDFPLIDAEADGPRRSFLAQLAKRAEATAGGQLLPVMLVLFAMGVGADIVHIKNIRLQNAEPLLAGLERA